MDVVADGLRFERDGRVVLDIPSLTLRSGRTTAVLGANGAGKTTLLRLIAALEKPTAGRILVGGHAVRGDRRPNVGFVFQEHVFLRQSVRENLELGLRLRGVPSAERKERIAEAARLLAITHLLGRSADRVSGGEARRVSLARALCLRAPLVLLDEPLAGLDPSTYTRLLDELPQVLRAFRATTLLVTHDRDEALRLGEDLVVLVDGRVRAAGGKREVVMRPAGTAVAEILGYTVLSANDRRIAVPAGALKLGPGAVEFRMIVDAVVDLVDRIEIVGRVGDVCVRVDADAVSGTPRPGDSVIVHAEQACDLG